MKRNKKEETRRKKFRALILLLFLSIIMFGTATYAWFTANRIVSIENIDVHVETSDGLQISTNGSTWKSVITQTDIKQNAYSGANNFIPETLDAVSTSGATTSSSANGTRLLNMYSSTIGTDATSGAYTISTAQVNESVDKTKFIAFDIFLKVSSQKDVYINSADSFSKVIMKEGSTDRGLKNAARMAFVPIGEAAATDPVSNITSAFYASNPAAVKIWEPNNDLHSTAVVNSVGTEYGFTGDNALSASGGNPVAYYGIKAEIPTANAQNLINTVRGTVTQYGTSPDNVVFSEEVTTGEVTSADGKYSTAGILLSTPGTLAASTDYKIFTLNAGITKMRVYMWIEGQDIDCENNASGTDITYSLELSIRETPATTTTVTP